MKRGVLAAALVVGSVAIATGAQASGGSGFNPDPVFPVGPISGKTSHQIAKLDHVATVLAGHHAIVNCWSQRDWTRLQRWDSTHHESRLVDAWGVTNVAKRRIELSPFVCQILAQTLARSARQPLWTASAVMVLAHESAHASGIHDESSAECRALRTEPRAARLLGISAKLAARFQHIYRGTIYPFESPQYRTPPCPAGRPGVVAPDTLGAPAKLSPLGRTAAAVARSLQWKNIGGADGIGPLSRCAPTESRTWEATRFTEIFEGPHGASAVYSAVRLRTQNEYATALTRYPALPRCELRELRTRIRETHYPATVSVGRIPRAVTRLSPRVRAYREIWTSRGQKWNRDEIFILDRAERSSTHLFFRSLVGKLPFSVELRATKAALRP